MATSSHAGFRSRLSESSRCSSSNAESRSLSPSASASSGDSADSDAPQAQARVCTTNQANSAKSRGGAAESDFWPDSSDDDVHTELNPVAEEEAPRDQVVHFVSYGRFPIYLGIAVSATVLVSALWATKPRPSQGPYTWSGVERYWRASTSPGFMSQAVVRTEPVPEAPMSEFAAGEQKAEEEAAKGCGPDEEMLSGLCYHKCSELTVGAYSFRQSAWTCCEREECVANPFNAFSSCCKHDMGWCSGFDVAGPSSKNDCPHSKGACKADEELFLGLCYKKCSSFDASLPFRVGPATCCKTASVKCIAEEGVQDGMEGESLTNSKFDVASGCEDMSSDEAQVSCRPHSPTVEPETQTA
mmetsp:Transcript_64322/g.139721  ORF Transcript_64322/g.139721 Transcript_64322/m.139721 type:complete len:357 (-) Transcript_64322:276-1346(-)